MRLTGDGATDKGAVGGESVFVEGHARSLQFEFSRASGADRFQTVLRAKLSWIA